ncbi:MAG: RIP metalloprotease RseP [Bacteroidales bacterium]|jgi:regulator of sigma E protease|nr:RIP metalloprotease RseP [Bacteroidales bacterium]
MESFLIKALQLIFSLSILVVIHELGHYLVARAFNIRVEKFYLFFDVWFPLLRYKPKNSHTEYGIGWLPFGGYVKIAGMIDESMDTEQMKRPAQPWEFRSRPVYQRLLVMIAGVVMNFVAALFIYSMVMYNWGDSYLEINKIPLKFSETAREAGFRNGDIILAADGVHLTRFDDISLIKVIDADEVTVLRKNKETKLTLPNDFMSKVENSGQMFCTFILPTVIDSIMPEKRAAAAGFQQGDSLVAINTETAASFSDFVALLGNYKNQQVNILLFRGDSLLTLPVDVDEKGQIGFAVKRPANIVQVGFWSSFPAGIHYGIQKLSVYVRQLKLIKNGLSKLGGFGTIGSIFPSEWNWQSFWEMTAFLSLILAFMNILPIPALDGGHVFFLLFEMFTRRKPSEKVLINAQYIGMAILLTLLLIANGNDVLRFLIN